jgi:predicted RNA-binding Zn-ribbon protein involved in translation (DUF1610 family)
LAGFSEMRLVRVFPRRTRATPSEHHSLNGGFVMATQAIGYPPASVYFCPECGSQQIQCFNTWDENGKLICYSCGLVCFLIEAEESHEKVKS